MNMNPNTSGISRKWKRGTDARVDIYFGASRCVTKAEVDAVIDALRDTVFRNRRTVIVGFGVFQWKPWRSRLPTGRRVETWRLTFKPSKYAKGKYDGSEG